MRKVTLTRRRVRPETYSVLLGPTPQPSRTSKACRRNPERIPSFLGASDSAVCEGDKWRPLHLPKTVATPCLVSRFAKLLDAHPSSPPMSPSTVTPHSDQPIRAPFCLPGLPARCLWSRQNMGPHGILAQSSTNSMENGLGEMRGICLKSRHHPSLIRTTTDFSTQRRSSIDYSSKTWGLWTSSLPICSTS
jgi:hypothetical protein